MGRVFICHNVLGDRKRYGQCVEASLSYSLSGIVIFTAQNVKMIALPGEAILFQVDESGVAQLCLRAF